MNEFYSRPLTPIEEQKIRNLIGSELYDRIRTSRHLTNFDKEQYPIFAAAIKQGWSDVLMIDQPWGDFSTLLGLWFKPEAMINGERPPEGLSEFWTLIQALEAIEKARIFSLTHQQKGK